MNPRTLAQVTIDYLRKHQLGHIAYGHLQELDDIYLEWKHEHPNAKGVYNDHPLNRHNSVLNALQKSGLFEKWYFRAHRGLGRAFTPLHPDWTLPDGSRFFYPSKDSPHA